VIVIVQIQARLVALTTGRSPETSPQLLNKEENEKEEIS
jgi:hypothetical protein